MSGIVHKGIIRKSSDGVTRVELVDAVDCESCSAKGGCQLGGARDNVYQVKEGMNYADGDLVEVEMSEQMAMGALFWAYIFPFIVLFVGLVALNQFMGEGLAGLIAIAFLAIYYIMVYLNRGYFDKKFELKIKSYD